MRPPAHPSPDDGHELTSQKQAGGILRATGYSLAFLVIGAPVLYVSYCETVRHAELRKRRARFESRRAARRSKRVAGAEVGSSALGSDDKVVAGRFIVDDEAEAGEEEKQDLRDLFASLRIGGRYANPFPEWREQVCLSSFAVLGDIWSGTDFEGTRSELGSGSRGSSSCSLAPAASCGTAACPLPPRHLPNRFQWRCRTTIYFLDLVRTQANARAGARRATTTTVAA